jgi:hypothetical protein
MTGYIGSLHHIHLDSLDSQSVATRSQDQGTDRKYQEKRRADGPIREEERRDEALHGKEQPTVLCIELKEG